MALPVRARRKIIDEARMPIGGRRDLRVGTPAIIVDARHDPMISILKADVDTVDLGSGGECLIKNIAALLGTEEARVVSRHFGHHPQRSRHVLDHGLDIFDRRLPCLFHVVPQRGDNGLGVVLVVVDQDKKHNGNREADEQTRHDHAEFRFREPELNPADELLVKKPGENCRDREEDKAQAGPVQAMPAPKAGCLDRSECPEDVYPPRSQDRDTCWRYFASALRSACPGGPGRVRSGFRFGPLRIASPRVSLSAEIGAR
jgi:hypothetical protein